MTYSNEGLEMTKFFEGLRLKAYQDEGGILTIGYGHRVRPEDQVTAETVWTEGRAEFALLKDVKSAEDFVNNSIDVELTQGQFDALVDFVYNLGPKAFKYSTLRSLIQSGQMERAADEFPRWNHVNGKVSKGLTLRRLAEKSLFEGRDWRE